MVMKGAGLQLWQPQLQLFWLSAVSLILVEGSPDPGRWTFNNISSEQNYIGELGN
jgi:hypothetical protein